MKSSHNPACAKLDFIRTDRSCLFAFLATFSLVAGGCSTEQSSIPFRSVINQQNLIPVPLESLEIHASPASEVEPLFKIAMKGHDRLCQSIQQEISNASEVLLREKKRLSEAKEEVATNYNAMLPKEETLSSKSTRGDLERLSIVRAQKSKTDASYEAAVESNIRPIEQKIANSISVLDAIESNLHSVRADKNMSMFNALPTSPSKTWVTDSDGHTSITVPKNEPWYVWASAKRRVPYGDNKYTVEIYHWILVVPDDLDENGSLFADNRNLLSVRGVVLSKSAGDLLQTDDVNERPRY